MEAAEVAEAFSGSGASFGSGTGLEARFLPLPRGGPYRFCSSGVNNFAILTFQDGTEAAEAAEAEAAAELALSFTSWGFESEAWL